MRHVTFYHKETGMLNGVSVLASDDGAIELNTPADHVVIDHPSEQPFDHMSQKMDIATGKIMDYRPEQPSDNHEWNAKTKRWELTATAAARLSAVRAASARLMALDAMSVRPLRALILGIGGISERRKLEALEAEAEVLRATINSPGGDRTGSGADGAPDAQHPAPSP